MKTFWVVLLAAMALFVYVNRFKLFLRDPLGAVTRNGTFEDGAQVYINYLNDVVVANDHLPKYLLVVQHGQSVGVPAPLKCLFDLLCLAQGYPVPQIAPLTGAAAESMTDRQVRFRDENAREVTVKIR
jgi:hypothetical protein